MKNNKPYMLCCFLYSPETTAMHYLRNFRKILGKDNVISCGEGKADISWDYKKSNAPDCTHDVELPERPHPCAFTYTELFDILRSKGIDTNFDLIFIAEPNFRGVVGPDNFRPDCHITYYACDTHRSIRDSMESMEVGKVDSFIYPNVFFNEVLQTPHVVNGVQYTPNKKLILSPTAFDPDVHKVYPDCEDYEKYDVIFVGSTGMDVKHGKPYEEHAVQSDKWAKVIWYGESRDTIIKEETYPLFQRGCGLDHRFGEYQDRSELLTRLKQELKGFKILKGSRHGIEYSKILNKGKCIVNMSIYNDLNMRVGEAMGCGRVLITDELLGMDSVCGKDGDTHIRFRKYYHPMNVNWDLCYDIIKAKILAILRKPEEIKRMQKAAYNWVRDTKQSYQDRCEMILEQTIGWKK